MNTLPFGLAFLRALPLPRKLGFLERIYGQKLSSLGVATVSLSNGFVWKLDLTEVTHRWLVYGDYEGPLQMEWIKSWLSTGGLFVDSGANIGQMVVSLAYLPSVEVIAFEPVVSERAWLESCLTQYPNWEVNVIPLGLSDHKRQLMIRLAGSRSTLRTDWYVSSQLAEEQIELTTLDSYSETHNINRIRLWKLDMEGHEVQALLGARKLLDGKRIDALLIEIQTNRLPQVLEILSYSHYPLYMIEASGSLRKITDKADCGDFFGNLVSLPA